MQLYTVRDQIDKDAAATLKAIADIGYKEVEVIRTTLAKVGPLAKQDGLAPVSIHVDIPLIMTGTLPNGYDLAACIRDAQAVGAKFLVMPYVMPNDRPKDAAGFEALRQDVQQGRRADQEGRLAALLPQSRVRVSRCCRMAVARST